MEVHGSNAAEKHQRIEALHQHTGAIRSTLSGLEAEAAQATSKIHEWKAIQQRIQDKLTSAPNTITLDVGGTIFKTTKQTLLRVEGSYFHALIGSDMESTACGPYFLDLDPGCFRHVLKFLRTGKMALLNDLTKLERDEVNMAMENLILLPPVVPPPSYQWGHRAPDVKLSSKSKTAESIGPVHSMCVAVVQQPLVGSIQLCVNINGSEGGLFGVGLGSTNVDKPTWESYQRRICYWSSGEVYESGRLEASLPKIKPCDIVTIRRGRSHVEIQRNTEPPCNIDLDDATDELFPIFATNMGGVMVSILD